MILPGPRLWSGIWWQICSGQSPPTIQSSFPVASFWPWIVASLLHLCPCGHVGWRNLIQLKKSPLEENKQEVFTLKPSSLHDWKNNCHLATVVWGERQETQGKSQQQRQLLLVLVWPTKTCSVCHAQSTLPVACLVFTILSLTAVLSPSSYSLASNFSSCTGLSSPYH